MQRKTIANHLSRFLEMQFYRTLCTEISVHSERGVSQPAFNVACLFILDPYPGKCAMISTVGLQLLLKLFIFKRLGYSWWIYLTPNIIYSQMGKNPRQKH